MDNDDFANVTWQSDAQGNPAQGRDGTFGDHGQRASSRPRGSSDIPHPKTDGDAMDLAGVGSSTLSCSVTLPVKENDGTKDSYVSYLVTTHTDFPSFQKPVTSVRRRFTDFVFLYNTLCTEYPTCAVPPLPDKHKMEYVTGDRFSQEFMLRRANSLNRFLRRLALHPVLRRSTLLTIFLESQDWNATMRSRPSRSSSSSDSPPGVFDNITETFINAFTKVHKADRRFIEVREKSDKLDEDLGHVEKIVARVARREDELQKDFHELGELMLKLSTLEPAIVSPVHAFTASIEESSAGMKQLKDHTDQDYLGSLRDMQAYSTAVKALLKAREQKQVDFEQTTAYLADTTSSRDRLANSHTPRGAGSFIRSKIEDVRGVDHEQSRRQRIRESEIRIQELTRAAEEAKKVTEAFDEETVREVHDFERIKRIEFKSQFGGLADAHMKFYGDTLGVWEKYVQNMEKEGVQG
ncbi:MAG: intercellular trafficking and secretion [Claussenomyces sp. TS43310]|nr:MAG: intercellular trafficking and secretion [Claussenomyces sp. TS43310]